MAVYYGYDEKGRLTGERQTVHHPQTEALLWPASRPDMRTTRRDWRTAVYRTACPPWNG
ncbi:putative yD repeat-containing domain protein [Escherichia coli P0298942.1]|nr:putative yD repeat-containing domain protein [Escherichia coli P0298942.1]